jgi:cytochrome c553
MNVVAKPLSDDDIVALADWFASLKVEVKEP